MADWHDVRRICAALPGTGEERSRQGYLGWTVGRRRFAWERPLRRADLAFLGDAAPAGAVLAVHTRDLAMKDTHLGELPELCFTTPHFDGYPAVLVRLEDAGPRELDDLLTGIWLLHAPRGLAREYLDGTG